MQTTEAIKLITESKTDPVVLYNLLIEDLYQDPRITEQTIAEPVAQALVAFYMYQIQSVLQPAISKLQDQLGIK